MDAMVAGKESGLCEGLAGSTGSPIAVARPQPMRERGELDRG